MSRHVGKAEAAIRNRQPRQLASRDQGHKQMSDMVDATLKQLQDEAEAALDRLEELDYAGGKLNQVDGTGSEVAMWLLGDTIVSRSYMGSDGQIYERDYKDMYVHQSHEELRNQVMKSFDDRFDGCVNERFFEDCLRHISFFVRYIKVLGSD